jgi:O-antigen/teichoic acid export membrane protein
MYRMHKLVSRFTGSKVLTGSSIMFAGSMIVNFGAYLFHVVIGRILGVEKYGELATLLSLFFILNVPSMVIQTLLTKYFASYKARNAYGEARQLFEKSAFGILFLGIVGFILFLPFIPAVSQYLALSRPDNLIVLYLILLSYLVSTVSISALIGFQMFFASSAVSVIITFLRLAFSAFGATLGVFGALWGSVGSNIIGLILFMFPIRFIFRESKKSIGFSKRNALSYSIPTLFSMLGMTLLYSQDVVLVKHFFPAATAGIYSSLNLFGKIIFFASSAVAAVVFPIITERRELKKTYQNLVYGALIGVFILSFGIVGVYFVGSSFMVTLLFGKSFQVAAGYLAIFGIFMAFITISNLLVYICLATNKLRVGMLVMAASILQIIGIYAFHASLLNVIYVNISISVLLFFSLLGYYRYGKEA